MNEPVVMNRASIEISQEMAEAEFKRFCQANRIRVREDRLDQEDLAAFRMQKDRIVDAIIDGYLVINDDGQARYTAENGQEVIFKKPKGSVLTALDQAKKNESMRAMFMAMGQLTELPPNTFSKMDLADTNACIAVTTLFLGS